MKSLDSILIQNNNLIILYDNIPKKEKSEISFILSAYGFDISDLEKKKSFKIPRFLYVDSQKVDIVKIIGSRVGASLLHEQSKRIVASYPEELVFRDILVRSESFARYLENNREKIIFALTNYETYQVANDEINRSIDLFRSIEENSSFYKRRVGSIVAFLPRNQPLYALCCFALVLSYASRDVAVHVPAAMKLFFPLLKESLDLEKFFPNVLISFKERKKLLEESSKLEYDPICRCWRSKTDVVIFTGTPGNAKKVKSCFDDSVLFITNGAGHNPVIVTPVANLEEATNAVLELQLYNQGQDCANPSAILVHESVHEEFVAVLLKKIKNVKVGQYRDRVCTVGPITKLGDLERIQQLLIDNKDWIHPETPGIIRVATQIVEPTVIIKPLCSGGNYAEQLSPVFFIQKYEADDDLGLYFNHKKYWDNAMYVTIYGKSKYVDGLIDYRLPNGSILHDESTIVRDTHLHAKGVERGTKPYGGYGRGASWININNQVIAKPTLPPRDIYEQLIVPSLAAEEVKKIPYTKPVKHISRTIDYM